MNISGAVKIKNYRAIARGVRGISLGLPSVWIQDLGIEAGDMIGIYRDQADRLILVLEEKNKKQKKRRIA